MMEFISKGLIPGKQAVQALSEQMQANNFGTMRKQAFELTGAMSTLSDNFAFFTGGELKDFYTGLTESVNRINILARDKQMQEWLHKMATNFKTAFSMAGEAIKWWWGVQKGAWTAQAGAIKWISGALSKWVGFVWDNYKSAARAAAWFADNATWLAQKGMGGAGDFFTKGLEKGIKTFESRAGQVKQFVLDIGTAFKETWLEGMPDFGAKWDEAGKKLANLKKQLGTPPKTHSFEGQFLTDAGDAQAKYLKWLKDQLGDSAKSYDFLADAARKQAQAVLDGTRDQIDALKDLRGSFTDTFSSIQQTLLSLGVIDNPLGGWIRDFEKMLDLGGTSQKLVAGAQKSFDSWIEKANKASEQARILREQQERVGGLDGVVPAKGGAGSGVGTAAGAGGAAGGSGSTVAAARSMVGLTGSDARAAGKAYGLEWCVGFIQQVNKAALGTTIANGTLKVADLRAWAQKTGRAYTGVPNVGDYMTRMVGGQRHAAVVSGVNQAKGTFTTIGGNEGAKDNYQSRVKEGAVYKIKGAGLVFVRADSVPVMPSTGPGGFVGTGAKSSLAGLGLAGAGSSSGGTPLGEGSSLKFDVSSIDGALSKISAVPLAWGAAVKNTEETSSRFALQTALASQEFQDALGKASVMTGKSVPAIVQWLRAFGNEADKLANQTRALDAVSASMRELEQARRAIGQQNSPLFAVLEEFKPGGKFSAAIGAAQTLLDKANRLKANPFVAAPGAAAGLDAQAKAIQGQQAAMLRSQAGLWLDQVRENTREATLAENDHVKALQRAGVALTETGVATGQYQIALERANREFEVWRSPDLRGLLSIRDTFNRLAGDAERLAKNLARNPFVSAPGALAAAQAAARGYRGEANGYAARANQTAQGRLLAGDASGEASRAADRAQRHLDTLNDYAARAVALKAENALLLDSSLSEGERARQIERSNFVLSKQTELLKQNYSASAALRIANVYWVKELDIKNLEKRNEAVREYNTLLKDSARAVTLAQGQRDIVLSNPFDTSKQEKQIAVYLNNLKLLEDFKKSGVKTLNEFNFNGQQKLFSEQYDANDGQRFAKQYTELLAQATQAADSFGDASSVAAIKWRTLKGDLSTLAPEEKQNWLDVTANLARLGDAQGAFDNAQSQILDLQKQAESGRLSMRRPMTNLQSTELDWKYQDKYSVLKYGERLPEQTAEIEAQRQSVRGLLIDWEAFSKAQERANMVLDGFSSAFGDSFDAILDRQKSWRAALIDGIEGTLRDLSKVIIQSQVRNVLGDLFGSSITRWMGGTVMPASGSSIGPVNAPVITGQTLGAQNLQTQTLMATQALQQMKINQQMSQVSASQAGGTVIVHNYTINGGLHANNPQQLDRQLESRSREQKNANNGPRYSNRELKYKTRTGLMGR